MPWWGWALYALTLLLFSIAAILPWLLDDHRTGHDHD